MRMLTYWVWPLLLLAPYYSLAQKAEYLDLIQEVAKNPSRESALTLQESSWRLLAESPWARGLRQTTKDTEDWLEIKLCFDLGPSDPWNWKWSLECGIRYSEYLEDRFNSDSYCLNRFYGERAYNSGLGWQLWEIRTARTMDIDAVNAVCGTRLYNGRKRSMRSCEENHGYTIKIDGYQPQYSELGGRMCLNGEAR